MNGKSYIVLMDADGTARHFEADDLTVQLLGAGISNGADSVKAAARHFAAQVHAMRRAQRGFFKAGHGTMERERFLKESKGLEQKVDAMLPIFNTTLEKL